ncbi:MAG: hypothetical protein BGO07_01405 [Alphaproteobacteria bacterium 40-19]|nr:MAG: hypothetical protein BGO07_01405 [Alphaproteobacteria bacterium 40-19]
MNLIKKAIYSILLGTSTSWAMIQEENMTQTQQYELRPGLWKFSIYAGAATEQESSAEQESSFPESLWVTKSDFSAQLKNILENLAISNASVWECTQAMTPLKKSKLEEGMNVFAEYVLDRSTHVLGWEEEGDQFGYELDLSEAEHIEAMPVRWSVGSSGGKEIYLTYQSGQVNNEDEKFFEFHITYKPQLD